MNKILTLFCLFIISFSDAYSQQTSSNKASKTKTSILFIGNSLTYTNNLPELVKKTAKQQGIKIDYKMIAFPDYSILDHWNEGEIQKLIATKNYDFVIIQQGPSSQINGRDMLFEYGKKYSSICKVNNAKLCYLTVWPSLNYYQSFDNVIKNYKDAALFNNAILLPVGHVWKDYFESTGNFQYYGSDGFHPSLEGSKIAAKTIVEYLFK